MFEKPRIQKKKENLPDKIQRKFREYKRYGVGLLKVAFVAVVLESCGEKTPELLQDYVAKHPTVESMAQDQKLWLESYIKSEKYKERLTGEVREYYLESGLNGFSVSQAVDSIIQERLNNLATCTLEEGGIEAEASKKVQGQYNPETHKMHYLSEEIDPTVMVHEQTHAATKGKKGMLPNTKRNLYRDIALYSTLSNEKLDDLIKYVGVEYGVDPGEMASRLNEIRLVLEKVGEYRANTEEFTGEHYKFLKDNFEKLFTPEDGVDYILKRMSRDKFIKMMNKYAQADGPSTVPNIFSMDVHFVEAAA